jgi:uncharacterized protein YjbI with pentapeptide repeats
MSKIGRDIMSSPTIEEAIRLLTVSNIEEFNRWRMKNLTVKPVLDGIDFEGKNLSGTLLNGISCVGTNFSHCNLTRVNLVQADLSKATFEGADLTDALLMYAEMKECNLSDSNLTRTNLMWANLQNSNLSRCKLLKTIFVNANLMDVKLDNVDRNGAYLKYANLKGTSWQVEEKEVETRHKDPKK